ncbi:unnamed protein product, partial [Sphacelaria rigidula]
TNSDQLQIKVAQGAEPRAGAELPDSKGVKFVTQNRQIRPGDGLSRPSSHHDNHSVEILIHLIHSMKNVVPNEGMSMKVVSEVGVGAMAAGLAKAKAGYIMVSGHYSRTGA